VSVLDNGAQVAEEHGAGPRSSHWDSVKKAFLKKHGNFCDACKAEDKGKFGLQVHHIHAYHIGVLLGRPDTELDERNFSVLCETDHNTVAPNHHLIIGHQNNFKRNNENLLEDIKKYKGIDGHAILTEATFVNNMKNASKEFPQWTPQEKTAYRKKLDEVMPPDPKLLAKYFPNGLPQNPFPY